MVSYPHQLVRRAQTNPKQNKLRGSNGRYANHHH